ncbi:hypothetical protein [Streptomyces pseudovenezuelae]|uniref:hypothetical protein n=1 Tax=Streptomyces pseudovenezuelae TaxID=67350 RepID=UPI0036E1DA93
MLVSALILIAVLVVAAVGGVFQVWWERRFPTSYTRFPGGDLAWWGLLSADEQEAFDTAALDAGEQAEIDAAADARDAAEFLVQRAQINAQFHP